jgi:hypothetical protein
MGEFMLESVRIYPGQEVLGFFKVLEIKEETAEIQHGSERTMIKLGQDRKLRNGERKIRIVFLFAGIEEALVLIE